MKAYLTFKGTVPPYSSGTFCSERITIMKSTFLSLDEREYENVLRILYGILQPAEEAQLSITVENLKNIRVIFQLWRAGFDGPREVEEEAIKFLSMIKDFT